MGFLESITIFCEKYGVSILTLLTVYLLLQIINPLIFQGAINHSSPRGFLANDAYWLESVVRHSINIGVYNEQPPALVYQRFEHYDPAEPPFFINLASGIGTLLVIESYDAIQFSTILIIISVILIVAAFLSEHTILAPLFLPFTFYIAVFPYQVSYTWGFWRQTSALVILIAGMYYLSKNFSPGIAVITGIFLSASILSYPFYPFLFLVLIVVSIVSQLNGRVNIIKSIALFFITSILFSTNYILDFVSSRAGDAGLFSTIAKHLFEGYNSYGANISFEQLPLRWFFLTAFLICIVSLPLLKKRESWMLLSVTIVSLTLLPSFGILERGRHLRFLWPVLFGIIVVVSLSIIIGVLNNLLKNSSVNFKSARTSIFSVVVTIFLLWIISSPIMASSSGPGSIISDRMWSAYNYINDNTPKNSTILVIDPIGGSQAASILGIDRKSRFPVQESFRNVLFKSIENGTPIENVPTIAFCQVPSMNRNWFSYVPVKPVEECSERLVNWCTFDYVLIQYINDEKYINYIQSQEVFKSFTLVYNVEDVVLLKRGDDFC
ncbi:hypothetical protein HY483_02060 [Candidatus Woesearchaeota archaeon]|nr:hypothetical protein [Candidatus Woesearchaeota archaeon]